MRPAFLIVLGPTCVCTRAATGDEFRLMVENDVWAHTDRYYTNGIKFGFGRRHFYSINLGVELP